MTDTPQHTRLLVVGAGVMGIGIVQVAAQAGHAVLLYDARPQAASEAVDQLIATFDKLITKGKLSEQTKQDSLARIEPISLLSDAKDVAVVIEAVSEDLKIKQKLFQQLEQVVAADCILATNTSSLSITAIANGLAHPQRLVGMHFFNPVPLMKLVEVVCGLDTRPGVAERIFQLCQAWGKHPVYATSTPGFIVNRIARPFYAEALELLQQKAVTAEVLDQCIRGAGFRMGPCELMDLIGHDTNFAVTQSVYTSNFYDRRYKPSLVQRELIEAGRLGRKTGRGFYRYSNDGKKQSETDAIDLATDIATDIKSPSGVPIVNGSGWVVQILIDCLQRAEKEFTVNAASEWIGIEVDDCQLRLTDGRCASQLGSNVAVFDLPLGQQQFPLAVAFSSGVSTSWKEQVLNWMRLFQFVPHVVADLPALVVARTIAMVVNEAADAVHQGVCSQAGADTAMKLGVNYPRGPFEWLAQWGAADIVTVLDRLNDFYRGERYRVSPWLRHRLWNKTV